jgi:polysaccharide export outer membrane protein
MRDNSEYRAARRRGWPVFHSLLLLLLLALLLLGVARAEEYAMGEGDLLKITVYDNPDLATDARVGADGKVTLPLIGEVPVGGMTTADAQKNIATRYAAGYIKNPQVNVFIAEYRSKKVTALGEFSKPGVIELRGNSTLMEVISNAGGITANAGDTLLIKRRIRKENGASEERTITIDLDRLLEKGDAGGAELVRDGDSIYVPRATFVFVSGEVKTPGSYKITKGLTVLRAITLAGGFTQRAARGDVSIVRKAGSGERTLEASMETPVLPDDVVVVADSFF